MVKSDIWFWAARIGTAANLLVLPVAGLADALGYPLRFVQTVACVYAVIVISAVFAVFVTVPARNLSRPFVESNRAASPVQPGVRRPARGGGGTPNL